VLGVIANSSGNLNLVFETILENATRICEATFGNLWLREDDNFRIAATHGTSTEYRKYALKIDDITKVPTSGGRMMRMDRGSVVGRAAIERRPVHIPDILADLEYTEHEGRKIGGWRAALGVPLLREGSVIGVLFLSKANPQAFTDKQITLVQSFAAQAVVAIENTRLLNELRESLEQQTATSQVLHVINSSPGELEPVFQTILENALRICEAKFGTLFRFDGKAFNRAAGIGVPSTLAEFQKKRGPYLPESGTLLDRILQTRKVAHSSDYAAEPIPGNAAKLGGARSTVAVPMLKDSELIGAIIIYRQEVKPFTDKQIGLVQNFAAQAVIAIENARLLNDLNNLNQQLEQRVTDQVSEIERVGRLRRFLPPQVADLIVASGTEKQLESHRREITALFCDLRGFTGFSESSDPEDVMALLREYHAAIGKIIIKYGGTLERYAGDGVMVVFNDPLPIDNPALQAVLMAIDMRLAIGELIEKWRKLGHDIGFGIGIAHGFATLGTIGFEGRFDYSAIGTVSNVASRLCDEAKAGQILISPRVLMAVEDAVSVEPVGEFRLKGISRPLATYNVLSAVSAKI
jgi:adenylate cyclase